jgi:hypothetical protein
MRSQYALGELMAMDRYNTVADEPEFKTFPVPPGLDGAATRKFVDDLILKHGVQKNEVFRLLNPGEQEPETWHRYLGPQEDNRNWILADPPSVPWEGV